MKFLVTPFLSLEREREREPEREREWEDLAVLPRELLLEVEERCVELLLFLFDVLPRLLDGRDEVLLLLWLEVFSWSPYPKDSRESGLVVSFNFGDSERSGSVPWLSFFTSFELLFVSSLTLSADWLLSSELTFLQKYIKNLSKKNLKK